MEMKIGKYKVLSFLGDGTFSSVYKVERAGVNMHFAMKVVELIKFNDKDRQSILNEINILSGIRHVNILEFKDCFINEERAEMW